MAGRPMSESAGSAPDLHGAARSVPRRDSLGSASGTRAPAAPAAPTAGDNAWSFLDVLGAIDVVEDHVDGFSDTEAPDDVATALASFPHAASLLRGAHGAAASAPRSAAAAKHKPRRRARTGSHGLHAGDEEAATLSPLRLPVADAAAPPEQVRSPVEAALAQASRSRAESDDATNINLGLRRTASLYSPRLAPSAQATPDTTTPNAPPRPPSLRLGSPSRAARARGPQSTVDFYLSRVRPRHATSSIQLARVLNPRPWKHLGLLLRSHLSILGFDPAIWTDVVNYHRYHLMPKPFTLPWEKLSRVHLMACKALGFHPLTWEMERRLRAGMVAYPLWTEELGRLIQASSIIDADEAQALVSMCRKTMSSKDVAFAALYTGSMLGRHLTPSARTTLLHYACVHGPPVSRDHVVARVTSGPSGSTEASTLMHVFTDSGPCTRVVVRDIVRVASAEGVVHLVELGKRGGYRLSVSGARTSRGAQACRAGTINLDMRAMNAVEYDVATQRLLVQPGATWKHVVRTAAAHGRTVRSVPLDCTKCTVAGSVSVGALGTSGIPLSALISSLDVCTAEGEVVRCSWSRNRRLLRHVIGGFGLYGVIVRLELETVPDVPCRLVCIKGTGTDELLNQFDRIDMKPGDAPAVAKIAVPRSLELDSAPWSLLTVSFDATSGPAILLSEACLTFGTDARVSVLAAELGPPEPDTSGSGGSVGAGAGSAAGAGAGSATGAGAGAGAGGAGASAEPRTPSEDPIAASLDEFLLPRSSAEAFAAELCRRGFLEDGCTVQRLARVKPTASASQATASSGPHRSLQGEPGVARRESASFAPHMRGRQTEGGIAFFVPAVVDLSRRGLRSRALDGRMVDGAAVRCGGTFSLAHELLFTHEQLSSAYPNVEPAFDYKRRVDPCELFTNQLYAAHGAPASVRHGQVVSHGATRAQASAAAAEARTPMQLRVLAGRRASFGSAGSRGSGNSGGAASFGVASFGISGSEMSIGAGSVHSANAASSALHARSPGALFGSLGAAAFGAGSGSDSGAGVSADDATAEEDEAAEVGTELTLLASIGSQLMIAALEDEAEQAQDRSRVAAAASRRASS